MIWYFFSSLPHIIAVHFSSSDYSTYWLEKNSFSFSLSTFVFNHWTFLFSLISNSKELEFLFIDRFLSILFFVLVTQIFLRLNIFLICNLRMKKSIEINKNKMRTTHTRTQSMIRKTIQQFFLLFRWFLVVICWVFCLMQKIHTQRRMKRQKKIPGRKEVYTKKEESKTKDCSKWYLISNCK